MSDSDSSDSTDNLVMTWGDSMSIIGGVCLIVFPAIIWHLREHPLMKIRMPVLVITEICINMILLIICATLFGSAWMPIWGNTPCVLSNIISESPNVLLLNISLARILVFYRTVQANVQSVSIHPTFDKFIHYLGVMFAPAEFRRLEVRIQLLHRLHSSNTSAMSNSTATMDDSSLIQPPPTTTLTAHAKERSFREGIAWIQKMFLWLLFWSVVEFATTYPFDGPIVFDTYADAQDVCIGNSIAWIGYMLIIICTVHLVIVCSCLHWINDNFGLKTELIVMQIAFTLFWGADGILQAFFPDTYAQTGIFTDLSAMFLHSLFTLAYPVILIWYRDRKMASFKNTKITTPDDLIRIWATQVGRAKIMDIAAKHFALESVLFLSETDNLSTHMGAKKIRAIYNKYLGKNAPFELNVPEQTIKDARRHMEKVDNIKLPVIKSATGPSATLAVPDAAPKASGELSHEDQVTYQILLESRHHIILTLFDNFKRPLELELAADGKV